MTDRRNIRARRQATDRRTADRRDENRNVLEAQIRFLKAGASVDDALCGELLDVSAAGLRMVLDEPLNLGDTILVEVRPQDERCFNFTARVVWSEPHDSDRHRVGCELRVELTPKQWKVLEQISSESTQTV